MNRPATDTPSAAVASSTVQPTTDARADVTLRRPRTLHIALVSVPFVSATRPSIQLGLLGATLDRFGFRCKTLHLYLDFAMRIGPELYEALAQQRGAQLGEWIFSPAAFGAATPDLDGRLLERFRSIAEHVVRPLGLPLQHLLDIRREAQAYVHEAITAEALDAYDVVGFSTTFQQNVASIAFASRLKQLNPRLITVFGGSNCAGSMGRELVRSVDCVDYVFTGEADVALPQFLQKLAEGLDLTPTPGVLARTSSEFALEPTIVDEPVLDTLPAPDYREYFARARDVGLQVGEEDGKVWVPFESSRGCWWGQKHHCTFCGLNAITMRYRAKSPSRVIAELTELESQTGSVHFEAVDNILDLTYLRTLLPELAELRRGYRLFYETKANLDAADVRTLAAAGVTRLQPGIESLNTRLLGLMRKGTTALQNVNLLRWTTYFGIEVAWNLLWGFPGERLEDYEAQDAYLPQLLHLQPPSGALRVWLERFSPMFADDGAFPKRRLEPEPSYAYVYPSCFSLPDIAYFFDYELEDTLPESEHAGTRELVRIWSAFWSSAGIARPTMCFEADSTSVTVDDQRLPGKRDRIPLSGIQAWLYTSCSDRPRRLASLARDAPDGHGNLVEGALQELVESGLSLRDGDSCLSLAIPSPHQPAPVLQGGGAERSR
jgi:ribosomal peptide maturation radical SAM protein 1